VNSLEIILASTSEIRRKILSNAGIAVSVVDSELDETEAKKSMGEIGPRDLALELAKLKSQKVSNKRPRALVIGADQVLGLKDRVFNKPSTRADAERQLLELRNETHTLFSAVSCTIAGTEVWRHCADARLTMRNFTEKFLASYLDANADDYLSSVGAYKLEKTGIQLFEKIEGEYFTILGLPMLPLLKFLREREVISS
jgi:septum formation protein